MWRTSLGCQPRQSALDAGLTTACCRATKHLEAGTSPSASRDGRKSSRDSAHERAARQLSIEAHLRCQAASALPCISAGAALALACTSEVSACSVAESAKALRAATAERSRRQSKAPGTARAARPCRTRRDAEETLRATCKGIARPQEAEGGTSRPQGGAKGENGVGKTTRTQLVEHEPNWEEKTGRACGAVVFRVCGRCRTGTQHNWNNGRLHRMARSQDKAKHSLVQMKITNKQNKGAHLGSLISIKLSAILVTINLHQSRDEKWERSGHLSPIPKLGMVLLGPTWGPNSKKWASQMGPFFMVRPP